MSALLSSIPIIGSLFTKITDLVSEAVVDKDKRNEILGEVEGLRQQVYMAELSTKTIPWVDALHKMGRQIQLYILMGIVFYCLYHGIDVPQWIVLLVGGPTAIYQLMKGRGK
jgi:hypothetical protein